MHRMDARKATARMQKGPRREAPSKAQRGSKRSGGMGVKKAKHPASKMLGSGEY